MPTEDKPKTRTWAHHRTVYCLDPGHRQRINSGTAASNTFFYILILFLFNSIELIHLMFFTTSLLPLLLLFWVHTQFQFSSGFCFCTTAINLLFRFNASIRIVYMLRTNVVQVNILDSLQIICPNHVVKDINSIESHNTLFYIWWQKYTHLHAHFTYTNLCVGFLWITKKPSLYQHNG